MRVTLDTTRLNDLSKTDINLYKQISNALQIAEKYVQDTFYVFPEMQPFQVKDMKWDNGYESLCASYFEAEGELIKESDSQYGISNSDFHVYVFVDDGQTMNPNTFAYSNTCMWVNDRPLIGYIKINIKWFENINNNFNNEVIFETVQKIIMHEFFHILGFDADNVKYFRDEQGFKITKSYFKQILKIKNIRGKQTQIICTPNLLSLAKDYYNCDSIDGVQFENDGDQVGYHWEKTLFFNEIMSPSFNKGNVVISKFTLAFFKDSNWFADVDLNQADVFQWGKGNGCNFLESCDFQYDEFVSSSSSEICSFDHTGKSYPNVDEFTDCHISFIYENQNCQDVNDLSNNYEQTGEIYGQNSRCFESNYILSNYESTSSARCYSYECDDELKRLKIFLSISGRIKSITCDENSELISAPSGMNGNLKCPKNIKKFCQFNKPCENFCSNFGYCLQNENKSECHCIDNYAKNDCSQECDGVLQDDDITCEKKCKKKQYINQQNQCQDCHENCSLYCVGPNLSDCRICPQFQYLEGLSCVSFCSQNYFQDEQTGECKACIKDCQYGCIFSADNCLNTSVVDSGLFIVDLDQYGQIQNFNVVSRIIFIYFFISSL